MLSMSSWQILSGLLPLPLFHNVDFIFVIQTIHPILPSFALIFIPARLYVKHITDR